MTNSAESIPTYPPQTILIKWPATSPPIIARRLIESMIEYLAADHQPIELERSLAVAAVLFPFGPPTRSPRSGLARRAALEQHLRQRRGIADVASRLRVVGEPADHRARLVRAAYATCPFDGPEGVSAHYSISLLSSLGRLHPGELDPLPRMSCRSAPGTGDLVCISSGGAVVKADPSVAYLNRRPIRMWMGPDLALHVARKPSRAEPICRC
jgi:hypothetical protein